MFISKAKKHIVTGLFTLGLANSAAMGSAGLPGKPLPPKTKPQPIYKYYDTTTEAELLKPILEHKRIISAQNHFSQQIDKGFFLVGKRKVHFSKLMIDFLRLLDEGQTKMAGTWSYGGGDSGHNRDPGWADPATDDRWINHAIDITDVNGFHISPTGADNTLKAVVALIDSLPPGDYELGFPREPYPYGKADSYSSWSDDLIKYFCLKRVMNEQTKKYECTAYDPNYTTLLSPTGQIILDTAKYDKSRWFMPWYTNTVLNLQDPNLLSEIAQKSPAEAKAMKAALGSGDKAEQIRYLMRDRNAGNAIADAMIRARSRGVTSWGFYGDALDHFHVQVNDITRPLPVDPVAPPKDGERSPLQTQVVDDKAAPRKDDRAPFSLKDLDNLTPDQAKFIEKLPGGRVRIKDANGMTVYEGDAQKWVDQVNEQQKRLLDAGHSVYDKVQDYTIHKIPTNARELRDQLLNELRMNAPGILNKVGDPLSESECPQVDTSGLSSDVLNEMISLPDSTQLSYSNFLDRVGDTQSTLCSLGYAMLDRQLVDELNGVTAGMGPPPKDDEEAASDFTAMRMSSLMRTQPAPATGNKMVDAVVAKVMSKRDEIFRKLGLSGLAKGLNLEAFNKLGDYADVVKSVEDVLSGKAKVGPEMINDIRQKLGIKIPDDLQIPQMPDFQLPGKPKRTPLNVKKKKRWDGLNIGKRDIIAMEGFAELAMGGTEESETLRAEAQSNMYVFGKDFNIMDGLGEMSAGPNEVSAELHMVIIGKDLFKPFKKSDPAKLTLEGPKEFGFNKKVGYNQTFTIGPVPVAVSAGGFVSLGMGYHLGLVATQVEGSVYPNAAIGGYAEAGIGFSGFLSAGAGASITVLDFQAPITGGAKIKFDEEGYPFLNVFIDTDCRLELLNGRVYAYAEFPVPFEIKKETMDIWKFQGPNFHHKIMSWNIDIGHQGAKSGGDLLDQTDREEAAAIQQAITLDNRKEALEAYRKSLKEYADQAFKNVMDEAKSATATHVRELDSEAIKRQKDLQDATDAVKKKLSGTST